MGRERKGSIDVKDGRIYARITWTDETGKKRQLRHRAKDEAHARELITQLLENLANQLSNRISRTTMTFKDLASYFTQTYLKPAKYIQGQKVEGLRSYKNCLLYLKVATEHFGNKLIKYIKWKDILNYKLKRLKTPTHHNKKRSLATVNRELAYLKRTFETALREGWIEKSPFNQGDSLISTACEVKRERILSKNEEFSLLDACVGRYSHLKPIIICALDTGMRMGEIYKLKWKDINWAGRLITIQAFNSKTLKERQVSMTIRLEKELWELWALNQIHKPDPDKLVFGILSTCKNAFDTIRKKTGLVDLRFHDLRHTAATRMIESGISLQQVGRILGHTEAQTTFRYINLTVDAAIKAANALDMWHLGQK